MRTIPGNGLIVANGRDENLGRVLARGCWTRVERLGVEQGWHASAQDAHGRFEVKFRGRLQGRVQWELLGEHNRMNALAAVAAARHSGVTIPVAVDGLGGFRNVKRRLEVRGVVNGITVYDDFAHHPTAIELTLAGLRNKVDGARILAVLEPRSNTMKMGIWKEALAPSLLGADRVFCYTANLEWDAQAALASLGQKLECHADLEQLVAAIAASARCGDHVLIMSNGGFGGIHDKLLASLTG